MIKNISSFTAKTKGLKPAIEGILITPDKIVATDSLKLIEISEKTGVNDTFIVQLPKGLKTFDRIERIGTGSNIYHKTAKYEVARNCEEAFPDYLKVIPEEGSESITITVNPEYLKDIAEAFSGENKIILKYYGDKKPIVFSNEKKTIKALLMQIIV